MKRLWLSFIIVFLLPSKLPAATIPCLIEVDTNKILPAMEKIVDDGPDNPGGAKGLQSKLVKKTCYKWIYTRGNAHIVVYRSPNGKIYDLFATTVSNSKTDPRSKACLERGVKTAKGLKQSFIDLILTDFKAQDLWIYNDLDIGPAHWLKCGNVPQQEFNESVETMIHELTHQLRKDNCLFVPYRRERICFDLPEDLPQREIAKFDEFPTKDEKGIEVYTNIQNRYLTAIINGPRALFDEMNTYIVSTKTLTAFLQTKGKSAIFAEDGTRSGIFLPIFLAYTVRYVEKVKEKAPEKFEAYFAKGKVARNHIEALLTEGEEAYREWLKATDKIKMPPKGPETDIWDAYLKMRQNMP